MMLIFISFIISCKQDSDKISFCLSNKSRSEKKVLFKINIDNIAVFNEYIHYKDFEPNCEYFEYSVSEGIHEIMAIADDSLIERKQQKFTKGDIVFVSYTYSPKSKKDFWIDSIYHKTTKENSSKFSRSINIFITKKQPMY